MNLKETYDNVQKIITCRNDYCFGISCGNCENHTTVKEDDKTFESIIDLLEELKERREKDVKYKWRDVSKKPDVGETIEIATKYKNYKNGSSYVEYHIVTMNEREELWTADDAYICLLSEADVWRLHEPYENEETE